MTHYGKSSHATTEISKETYLYLRTNKFKQIKLVTDKNRLGQTQKYHNKFRFGHQVRKEQESF